MISRRKRSAECFVNFHLEADLDPDYFMFWFINGAVSISDNVTSNGKTWKEAVVISLDIIGRNLPGRTEENRDKPQGNR
jgi:hypothetical protein